VTDGHGPITKLLDVDKVDLVVGPYSTVQTAPAMATVIEHGKVIIGLSAININGQFHYPKYFAMTNAGPRPNDVFSEGFLAVAMKQTPKPQTIALLGADNEFSQNVLAAARKNAAGAGLKIVYDKSYPPSTVDYSPSFVRCRQRARYRLSCLLSARFRRPRPHNQRNRLQAENDWWRDRGAETTSRTRCSWAAPERRGRL